MPDTPSSMHELAERLLVRTEAGDQKWTQLGTATTYQTTAGGQVITVFSVDEDGNHPFGLSLWRRKPDSTDAAPEYELVESINTGTRSALRGNPKSLVTLANLWAAARNDALGVSASIQAALDALADS